MSQVVHRQRNLRRSAIVRSLCCALCLPKQLRATFDSEWHTFVTRILPFPWWLDASTAAILLLELLSPVRVLGVDWGGERRAGEAEPISENIKLVTHCRPGPISDARKLFTALCTACCFAGRKACSCCIARVECDNIGAHGCLAKAS